MSPGPCACRRPDAGQTTALVASMLFTLTIFVALVVNIGQLVNRRVSLQVVADAGAWSGATVQATQLNHYAFWSRTVQNAYSNAAGVSHGFRFGECASGWAAVGLFYYANTGMGRAIKNFMGKAESEARHHSLFNIDDLFPGERNNFEFSMNAIADGGPLSPAGGNIIPLPLTSGSTSRGNHAWSRETAGQVAIETTQKVLRYGLTTGWFLDKKASMGTKSWTCYTPPTYVSTVTMYVTPASPPGWRLQKPGLPYLFVWKVKEKQATRALFFDKYFGPNAIPAMTAVAVAKPVGGHVKEGRSRYRARMIPVKRYGTGLLVDAQARPNRYKNVASTRRVTH